MWVTDGSEPYQYQFETWLQSHIFHLKLNLICYPIDDFSAMEKGGSLEEPDQGSIIMINFFQWVFLLSKKSN